LRGHCLDGGAIELVEGAVRPWATSQAEKNWIDLAVDHRGPLGEALGPQVAVNGG